MRMQDLPKLGGPVVIKGRKYRILEIFSNGGVPPRTTGIALKQSFGGAVYTLNRSEANRLVWDKRAGVWRLSQEERQ